MTILIFILVLVVLIVVHELGHFIAAKWVGMRVEEFGLGYPPRAATLAQVGETRYTLNWLPFGGFVRIFGEDPAAVKTGGEDARAFFNKHRLAQAFVLVAGVAMNLLFAYVLITGALVAGTPRALSAVEAGSAREVRLGVAAVLPGSPAARAGVEPGDVLLSAEDGHYDFTGTDPEAFTKFVAAGRGNTTIALTLRRANGEEETLFARPETGLVADEPSRPVLGIELARVGVAPLPLGAALSEGAVLTWGVIRLTAEGLANFFYRALTLRADLSQVAGPVGIAGAVGTASLAGVGDLLSLVAIISINLALINLIPIPALDGGRLLFVIIESITRRAIKPRVAYLINAAGFALLLLLMVVVTTSDVVKLVR